jgi:hypothetical protein
VALIAITAALRAQQAGVPYASEVLLDQIWLEIRVLYQEIKEQ